MNTSLLRTKLIPPPANPNLVPREEVFGRIEGGLIGPQGFTRKLTLICAPAGFGKSTVVSQWMHRAEHRTGYLSLDVEDNVPERFWVSFFEAIRGVYEGVRDDALTALSSGASTDTSEGDSFEPIERFLSLLLNDILASNQSIIVVLDDAHCAFHPLINRGMRFALRNQPRNLHIVAVSRVEPEWELHRLRLQGEMLEVGPVDLRFHAPEILKFFRDTMQYPLAPEDIGVVESYSEGWIAGLQLAALSIRASGGMEGLRQARDMVRGFVSEQVIDELPGDIQAFLCSTSILNRLSGPLCDAVTETTGSAAILARLERENYFVSALGEGETWFRYHSLFQDALQTRLRTIGPDCAPVLHRRAYRWFDKNGHREEAVQHAIKAGEHHAAAEIVERDLNGLGSTRTALETRHLIAMIPTPMLRRRPILLVLAAYFAFLAGKYNDVEDRLTSAESLDWVGYDDSATDLLKGLIATFRGMAAAFSGNRGALDRNAAIAGRLITPGIPQWRGVACAVVGDAAFFCGDTHGAESAYTEACDLGLHPAGNPYFALVAGVKLALLLFFRKGVYASERVCCQMLAFAETRGYGSSERAATYLGLLGRICSERGEIDAAVEHCRRGIVIAERDHVPTIWCWCVAHMIRPLIIRRRYDEAHDWIRRADGVLADSTAPLFESLVVGWKIRLLLAEQDFVEAETLLNRRQLFDSHEDTFFFREAEFGSLIRFYLLSQRYSEAADFLGRYLRYFRGLGSTAFTAEIEFLFAVALYHLDRGIEARSRAKSSLATGRAAGFRRVFIDDASYSRVLLAEAHTHGIESEFCASLLAEVASERARLDAAPEGKSRAVTAASITGPYEPLSEREVEVLRSVAAGRANQEIADELFVSLNTVKWHLGRIFGKLAVDNRTHAAAEARRLGLIGE